MLDSKCKPKHTGNFRDFREKALLDAQNIVEFLPPWIASDPNQFTNDRSMYANAVFTGR